MFTFMFYGETSHQTNLFVNHPAVAKWDLYSPAFHLETYNHEPSVIYLA